MSQEPLFGHIGPELEACYASAVDDWLKYHKGKASIEDALLEYTKGMKVEAQLRHGRKALVIITIQATRIHDSATYAFEANATPYSAFKATILG